MTNSVLNQSVRSDALEDPSYATPIDGKPVMVDFEGGNLTSDAGVLLLREVEQEIGIVKTVAKTLSKIDSRDSNKISHTIEDLVMQRVSQIACGYEDANDSNDLRHDPAFKTALDRAPDSGDPLASQPTFSRFENSIDKETNDQLEEALIDHFIASYPTAPKSIVLDFDQTVDLAHGAQEEICFQGYYQDYCYMPLHVYEGHSGKLITTVLMPGKRPTGEEMLKIVKRILSRLHEAWPQTLIIYRGDGHFPYPQVLSYLEKQPLVQYVVGLPGNMALRRLIDDVLVPTQRLYEAVQQPVKRFHSIYYQAGSWTTLRRVVVKIEVSDKGTNIRYVVTSLTEARARDIYQVAYCQRGMAELYIKDHKTYLKSDRTSCHLFEANRFRLLMHSVAYVLMHALRNQLLAPTRWARTTMQTLRLNLLKVSARVRELKTRIKVELASSFPHKADFSRCFQIMAVLRSPG